MSNNLFLQAGDKLKATQQNYDFNVGEKYEVVQVINSEERIIVMKNRRGFNVPVKSYGIQDYDKTGKFQKPKKLQTTMEDRRLSARLLWFFKSEVVFYLPKDNNKNVFFKGTDNKVFYNTTGRHTIIVGGGKPSYEAIIVYRWVIENGEKQNLDRLEFTNYEDYVKYFKTKIKKEKISWWIDFKIADANVDYQQSLDIASYIQYEYMPTYLNFPQPIEMECISHVFTHDLANFPFKGNWRRKKVLFTEEFFETFDKIIEEIIPVNRNEFYRDIIELHVNLPSSHGATSVAKILKGRSKAKLPLAIEYGGKYSEYSYDFIFQCVDYLETYLHSIDAFGGQRNAEVDHLYNTTVEMGKISEIMAHLI